MNRSLRLSVALAAVIWRLSLNDARATDGDYVILLHGAGRTPLSMRPMESYLRTNGYRVINARFPSAGLSIEQIADTYFPKLVGTLDSGVKIHFVAHSMGAIILRQYLVRHTVTNLGRVVMLAPPNHGSEIIDHLRANPLLRLCLGPRLLELGTGPDALPQRLGPANFDCGVIAGDSSANPITGPMLHGANDGKVTVESARLDGAKDFLVLHHSHTWLIWKWQTFHQIAHFLRAGTFDRNTLPADSI
jgi:triacylglycerol lipase